MIHLREVRIRPERFPTTEHYPFSLDVFQHTSALTFDTPVTLFAGENGSGKSTLLWALCRRCDIHIWEGIEWTRCEVNPYEKDLYRAIDVKWTDGRVTGSFFSSEIFRNFSKTLDQWAAEDPGALRYFGGKSLLTQSHGESLMSYFRSRYKIKGLYLLDEPETALSPRSQLGLLEVLKEMSAAGHAQFIIASHSPIILACPGAKIYSFDHTPVEEIAYEDTEHYQVYSRFLADRKKYLE